MIVDSEGFLCNIDPISFSGVEHPLGLGKLPQCNEMYHLTGPPLGIQLLCEYVTLKYPKPHLIIAVEIDVFVVELVNSRLV